jgi:hypothetical protein
MPIGTIDGQPVGKGAKERPLTQKLDALMKAEIEEFVRG